MPRKSRTVLDPESATFGHAGQVEQHRESGGAFDQCADRGAVKSDDEVAFPVSRNSSVLGLGGPLADHDVGAYKLLAATTAASPRHAQRPPGAQAGRQLAAQCPPPLDVQRLVDGLVRDLCALYPKPRTSQPAVGHTVYPYLLRGLSIERPNQVWATDICYIPMAHGFMYLVAIMDW